MKEKMKTTIFLEKLRDTWRPNNESMFNGFTGFDGYEYDVIEEFDNLEEGLQALKECTPIDYSYPGKIEIISYALSIYKNDDMDERYEWTYEKTNDGIKYELEKTM